MAQRQVSDLSAELGLATKKVLVDKKPVLFRYVCCEECGVEEKVRHVVNAPPDNVAKTFKNKGWEEHNGEWVCPKCKGAHSAKRSSEASGRPASAKEIVLISGCLSSSLVDGRFRKGISDETIAAGLGLSAELVRSVRDELHGPLAQDPEVVELKKELERVRSELETLKIMFEGDFAVAKEKIEKMLERCEKAGW